MPKPRSERPEGAANLAPGDTDGGGETGERVAHCGRLFEDRGGGPDVDHPVAAGGEVGVVGDQHQGGTDLGDAGEEEIGDVGAGRLVEIAGRLVGDDDRGAMHQGAGDGDALLFATGELRGVVIEPVGEADGGELGAGAGEGVGAAGEFERGGDVLERRHVGDEMERLEDDADGLAAKAGEAIGVETGEVDPGDRDPAAVGALQAAGDHQRGRLAGAGGADDADPLAGGDGQGETAQDVDGGGAVAEPEANVLEGDGGSGQDGLRGGSDGGVRDANDGHGALVFAGGDCHMGKTGR